MTIEGFCKFFFPQANIRLPFQKLAKMLNSSLIYLIWVGEDMREDVLFDMREVDDAKLNLSEVPCIPVKHKCDF